MGVGSGSGQGERRVLTPGAGASLPTPTPHSPLLHQPAPLISGKIDAAPRVEEDALAFEKLPLPYVVAGWRAQRTLCVDDTLPWDARVGGQCMQRVPDETRLAGNTGDAGYLAVGRHTASRNSRHDRVNPLMQTVPVHDPHGKGIAGAPHPLN